MAVIALVSPQGGSGKTVSTMLLGRVLAESGAPTLLMDCDPGCGLSCLFDSISRQSNIHFDLLEGNRPQISPTHLGFDVAGGDFFAESKAYSRLSHTPEAFWFRAARNIKSVFEILERQYNYICIDTAPRLSEIELLIVSCADVIAMPLIMDETVIVMLAQKMRNIRLMDSLVGQKKEIFVMPWRVHDANEVFTRRHNDIVQLGEGLGFNVMSQFPNLEGLRDYVAHSGTLDIIFHRWYADQAQAVAASVRAYFRHISDAAEGLFRERYR